MRPKLTIAIIALALIAALLLLGRDAPREETAPAAPVPSPSAGQVPGSGAEPAGIGAASAFATIETHATLAIDRAALSEREPLVLDLELGDPAAGAAPLSGRLVVEGREPIDLTAAIRSEGHGIARLELERGWLSPGRNLIEIRTDERTHLPLRRYVVEVR